MINYKAVLLGVLAGLVGAFGAGFVIGLVTVPSSYSSFERYLMNHIELLYTLNVSAGLLSGLAVTLIAKRRLFWNILLATTILLVLSVLTNPRLVENLLEGRQIDRLLETGIFPLLAGWAAPFIFVILDIARSGRSSRASQADLSRRTGV